MKLKQILWYYLEYIEMTVIIFFFFFSRKISTTIPLPLAEKQIIEDNFAAQIIIYISLSYICLDSLYL